MPIHSSFPHRRFRVDVLKIAAFLGLVAACGRPVGEDATGSASSVFVSRAAPMSGPAGTNKVPVTRGGGYLSAGYLHTCALLDTGAVKCWGHGEGGQLGLGDTRDRGGSNEMGDALPAVDLGRGRSAVALSAGGTRTCAVLDSGAVKCWGSKDCGPVPTAVGDALPAVDLGTGRRAVAVSAGGVHACAILDTGAVKCWGHGEDGQLGLGDTNDRDDANELGDALPAVDLGKGSRAVAVSAGGLHTCALLATGAVKCWGENRQGQLGLGDGKNRGVGPNEMGDALPAVDLGTGGPAVAVSAGRGHTCALLDTGAVKCWGEGMFGRLGLGDGEKRGDGPNEMGDSLPAVDLGAGRAVAVSAGGHHTCAVLDTGAVKCWGAGHSGELGLGDKRDRGGNPNEMGGALPAVDLGGLVR